MRNIKVFTASAAALIVIGLSACQGFGGRGSGGVAPNIKNAYKKIVEFENEIVSGSGRIELMNGADRAGEGISPLLQLSLFENELNEFIGQDMLKRRSALSSTMQLRRDYFNPLISEFGVTYSLAKYQNSSGASLYSIQELIHLSKRGKVKATSLFTQRYGVGSAQEKEAIQE